MILIAPMFVPLVSLIVLLVPNAKATARLRAPGYHLGLVGRRAEKADDPAMGGAQCR